MAPATGSTTATSTNARRTRDGRSADRVEDDEEHNDRQRSSTHRSKRSSDTRRTTSRSREEKSSTKRRPLPDISPIQENDARIEEDGSTVTLNDSKEREGKKSSKSSSSQPKRHHSRESTRKRSPSSSRTQEPSTSSEKRQKDTNGGNGGKTANVNQEFSIITTNPQSQISGERPRAIDMPPIVEDFPRSIPDNSIDNAPVHVSKASPPSKFTSFFGWRSSPKTGTETPSTEVTKSITSSPPPPLKLQNPALDRSTSVPGLFRTMTNDTRINDYQSFSSGSPRMPFNMSTVGSSGNHVDELERELMEVSTELANSIRREMELEDEIERYRMEQGINGEGIKRSSDYFSDSGSSLARTGSTENDGRIEELERARRRLEQEKGQMRAEFSAKLADEYKKRKEVVSQVEFSQKESMLSKSDDDQSIRQFRDLETTVDDLRRKLAQERESKNIFEDLMAALKAETTELRQERDNLLDEVIPPLKVRVEGLEQENARIHQEFGYPNQQEEVQEVKDKSMEVKEIEEQRNALQTTLKNLLRRHDVEKRDHQRVLQKLTNERDAAIASLGGTSPSSRGIAMLRDDVAFLRTRANDALKQKWLCEDSISNAKSSIKLAQQKTNLVKKDTRPDLAVNTDRNCMVDTLRRNMQLAESERDAALSEAAIYRDKAQELGDTSLAKELMLSVDRLESYAAMLNESVRENDELRQKLAKAIDESEEEQVKSAAKIVDMQSRLRELEHSVKEARQKSEATLANHEKTETLIRANERPQVSRITIPGGKQIQQRKGSAIYWVQSPVEKAQKLEQIRQPHSINQSHHSKTHHNHHHNSRHHHAKKQSTSSRASEFEEKINAFERSLAETDDEVKEVVTKVEKASRRVDQIKQARDETDKGLTKIRSRIKDEKKRAEGILQE